MFDPIDFFKRWGKGMMNLSMSQQLHAKMVGHFGGMIGLVFAIIFMVLQGLWYFVIFMIFMTWLQWIEFVGTRKKLKNSMQLEEFQKNFGGGENNGDTMG
jgi:predicted tellurium resistance membrane protein TerC